MTKLFPHNQRAGLMQWGAVESLKREQSKSGTFIILLPYFDNNKKQQVVLMKIEISMIIFWNTWINCKFIWEGTAENWGL